MAINIQFDTSHNPELPTLILAKRNGTKLGKLEATSINLADYLNDASEITFTVNKYIDGELSNLWDEIINFRLIWCENWDLWFEITTEIEESETTCKRVTCTQLGHAELSQIMLYDIEINTESDIERDDYEIPTVLYNPTNIEASLLNRIMEKAPHYSIAHVDETIANIQRTFSFNDTSIYDAFQEIAEEIGCIFVFNSNSDSAGKPNRTISVYDLESNCDECGYRGDFTSECPECGSTKISEGYGNDTTIFVSSEGLGEEIQFTTDTGSVKNCFKLVGGDDLMTATIKNCNPNGSDYIWYITDETKKDMSDELKEKLESYDKLYQFYRSEYVADISSDLLDEYNSLVEKYQNYNSDLETLDSAIVGYSSLMTAYYNTIDLELYLESSLMPDASLSDTSATEQASLLTSENVSPVAVTDMSNISLATANSVVLAMAKVVVNSRYQVKVGDSSLISQTWTGNFIVTNYSDEDDTATSEEISIEITDDYEEYLLQMIEKELNDDNTDDLSITGLFEKDYDSFCEELKKYCLNSLTSFYDSCQTCLDILIEQGVGSEETWAGSDPNLYDDLYVPYYNKLQAIESEMTLRQEEIDIIVGTYDSDGNVQSRGMQMCIEDERTAIQNILDFKNYIGEELWLEFCAFRREDKYQNDNYISDGLDNSELFSNAIEFIEVAEKEIYKSAELQHSISATLKNLLVIDKFKPLLDYFEIGNWIRISVDDTVYKLRLIGYEIDYDNLDSLSVDFSDVLKTSDGISDKSSLLNQAATMASSYSSTQRQASQGSACSKTLDSWCNNGLDVTNTKIISGASSQSQSWDSHGMLFRKYNPLTDTYESTQSKIINSTYAITDDNWKTIRTAIGNFYYTDPKTGELLSAYGINGEVLIGNLILGEQLGIYTEDGSMTFDKDGLIIDTSSGTAFTIKNGDNVQFYIDSDGNVALDNGASITWGNIDLTDLILSSGNIVVYDENGKVVYDEDGNPIDITTYTANYVNATYLTSEYITANCIDVNTLEAELANITDLETSSLRAKIAEISQLSADSIMTTYLNAEYITANCIDVNTLEAELANIVKLNTGELYTAIAEISQLSADSIVTTYLNAEYITTNCIDVNTLDAELANIIKLNASQLSVALADIGYLTADSIVANYLTASYISSNCIDTTYLNADEISAYIANMVSVTTSDLYAEIAKIADLRAKEISADYIDAAILEADYIKTSDLDAQVASIVKLTTSELYTEIANIGYLLADELDAQVANIVETNTSKLNAALANIGYLTADSIAALDITADVANIKSLLAGNAGVGNLQAINLSSSNVVIADATIKDAMIASITASKLTAGTIYTDLVTIQSNADDSSLWISGSVIQMSDENTVRVQIGKDGNGSYNFYIWDSDGNLMWNALGVTSEGLNENIIVDKNVADDAAIKGTKLDIESVSSCLNEKGLIEVDASNVVVDNTTLSAAYTTITGSLSDLEKNSIATVTTYYAFGNSDEEPPSTPSADSDIAASVVGSAVVGKSNLGIAYWTTERLTSDSDEVYVWVAYYIQYNDGSTKWTTPTCITDGYLRDTTSMLQTNFEVISGQISSKVWLTDITEATNELGESITEINDKYSQVVQDYSGITTTIADLTTTVDSHTDKITTIEATADGITRTIEEVTATADGNYDKITKIDETVGGITTSVSNLQSTVNGHTEDILTVTETADELTSTVKSLNESLGGISESVSTFTQTADNISASVTKLQGESLTTETVYFAIGGSSEQPPSDPSDSDSRAAAQVGTAIIDESEIDTVQWTTERLSIDGDGIYLWMANLLTYADGSTEWTTPICITDNYLHTKVTDMASEFVITAESIASSVWKNGITEITDSFGNSITVLQSLYSEISQTAENINLRVVDLETYGAEQKDIVSQITIDVGEIDNRVSSTETDLKALNNSAQTGSTYEYYKSTSPTELVGDSWSTTVPTWEEGYYIWRRTVVVTGVGEYAVTTTTDPICITGNTGESGADGQNGVDGADGVGIVATTSYYAVSGSSDYYPTEGGSTVSIIGDAIVGTAILGNSGLWSMSQPEVGEYEYLWMKILVEYSDGTNEYTEPCLLTDVSTKTAMYTLTEKYSDINQTIDSITLTVSDLQESYYSSNEEMRLNISAIKLTSDSIVATVQSINETVKGYTEDISAVEQTAKSISASVTKLQGESVATETVYFAIGGSSEQPPSDPSDSDSKAAAQVGTAIIDESEIDTVQWTTERLSIDGDGIYLWTANLLTYADGSTEWTTPVCITDNYLHTKVTDMEAELKITAESITSSVWMSGVTEITDSLGESITVLQDLYSNLSQTATDITARVETVEGTANGNSTRIGTLETTADSITARVEAVEGTASTNTSNISDLVIKAGEIASSVTTLEASVGEELSTLKTSLTETASEIRGEVSAVKEIADGNTTNIESLSSSLTETASEIRGEVSAVK
ncbi:MAG: hypothetical protein LUG91_00115, partial [Ruminococcus sp.]|nr:hypothetical protein [Ruminococcus sp.]